MTTIEQQQDIAKKCDCATGARFAFTADWPTEQSIKEVCHAPGPFVTILFPACHPGAADLSGGERIETLLRKAEAQLESSGFGDSIDAILKPLRRFIGPVDELPGGSAAILFASPTMRRYFQLGEETGERVIVSQYPYITPLLPQLSSEREFWVLAMTKRALRLGRWREGKCVSKPFPPGVPASFEQTQISRCQDHEFQNHSTGSGALRMGPTRFGTGSQRDEVHERMRAYFHDIDRFVSPIVDGAPLVLVGIAQEMALYRSASHYERLLCAEATSPEQLTWNELGQLGEAAILKAQREDAQRMLAEFREVRDRSRVVLDAAGVLEAALEGRVHQLFLERSSPKSRLNVGPGGIEAHEDLVNMAAVRTVRARGKVFVLDPGELGSGDIAALLRYAMESNDSPAGEKEVQIVS